MIKAGACHALITYPFGDCSDKVLLALPPISSHRNSPV